MAPDPQDSPTDPDYSDDATFRGMPFPLQIWCKASEDVHQGSERADWNPCVLPLPLRTVWAVEAAQSKIMNGNVQYFFENDWPEQPPYSLFVDAFRTIGAAEAADCLADAVDAFGFPDPHLDYLGRRRVMDAVDADGKPAHANEVIDQLGRRLMDLEPSTVEHLAAFVARHQDFFPRASAHIKAHPERSI